ncbi:uncharacterized protein LOC142337211 [Convolutriloba macropyga]|uniref:uncharacterized protein LOC142337211 n=1 Tax=Convolutriloba macropyga TaxID=536237 RepID=UPI003F51C7DC
MVEPVACCVSLVDENERLLQKINKLKCKLKLSEKRILELQSGANLEAQVHNQNHPEIANDETSLKYAQENFQATKAKLLAMQNNTTRLLHAEQNKCRDLQTNISELESSNRELLAKLDNEKQKVFTLERQISRLENEAGGKVAKESKLTELKLKFETLTEENERLRRELSCFDQEFFEELEDMKYELKRSKELNKEYESVIKKLCEKYKLPLIKIT